MFTLVAVLLLQMLESPKYHTRAKVQQLPWPVLVAVIPQYTSDTDLRVTRRRNTPHWYRIVERDPWILSALSNKNPMYKELWLRDQNRRTRFYNATRALGLSDHCMLMDPWWREALPEEVTEHWCRQTLYNITQGVPADAHDDT